MRFSLLASTTIAVALSIAAPASAAIVLDFSNVGDSDTVDFNGIISSPTVSGLTGDITYTLESISNGTWTFDYTIQDTSNGTVSASRISTFGFDVSPTLSSDKVDSGATFGSVSSGNVPMVGNVDFCLTAGPNCAGGGGGGVSQGGSASGSFDLHFTNSPTTVELSDLYVRYQSINATGYSSGSSGIGDALSIVTGGVPEPASWALMILGFGGVGAVLRHRRRQAVLA